jgi:hypothetical protein
LGLFAMKEVYSKFLVDFIEDAGGSLLGNVDI